MRVVVILSCILPMSVARVGWYPTAEGIRPNKADTSEPAWVNLPKQNHTNYEWVKVVNGTSVN